MEKENKRTDSKKFFIERIEENQKLFTKNECNNIMKKDYNPLKVNCKIYESEGLFMESEINNVIKKLSKENNKKEMLILEMIKKCKEDGYDIQKSQKIINEFYNKK